MTRSPFSLWLTGVILSHWCEKKQINLELKLANLRSSFGDCLLEFGKH